VHGTCLLGILATLPYAWLHDAQSAIAVTSLASLAYATANLVQLDLAAQAYPPEAAGSVFALLMSMSNLGELLGTWTGGELWRVLEPELGIERAYLILVLLGAASTALAWLAAPWVLSPATSEPGAPIATAASPEAS